MKLTKQLIIVAEAFAKATEISMVTLSKRLFGRGDRFACIEAGDDLRTKKWEALMLYFSKSWPKGVAWPKGIDRPDPKGK